MSLKICNCKLDSNSVSEWISVYLYVCVSMLTLTVAPINIYMYTQASILTCRNYGLWSVWIHNEGSKLYEVHISVRWFRWSLMPMSLCFFHKDDFPEAEESFLLNITEVRVMGITPPPGAEPSVKIPGNILRASINENDGIRGIVQFNVTTVNFLSN